ncbi:hypothetical protein C3K47_08175 [Solitalea longa]|uniref:PE-PGRS family protein n=1 Tax=Solitalea longa TaxID=2079460 RepID=A0A2S5A398_9SPHI|nr:hypothetical protein [Solitalea longa]POY37025.1 hypothetical protein C3K47_08175 [Solitalea longa]
MVKSFFKISSLIVVLGMMACSSPRLDLAGMPTWGQLKGNTEFKFDCKTKIENSHLTEISGVVNGYANPGFLYVQEDSFSPNRVYILDTIGHYYGSLNIRGCRNFDWEDLAIGPGPENGKNYIYVADIGDNLNVRNKVLVFRFEEPDLTKVDFPVQMQIKKAARLRLKYPKGRFNAETILLDPISKDVFVITKGEQAGVFKAEYPQNPKRASKLKYLGALPIQMAAGGSISANGTEIAIKNYTHIYYWKRQLNEPIDQALKRTPDLLPYTVEPQGEAISFTKDGRGYYTISEVQKKSGLGPMLYFYKRK